MTDNWNANKTKMIYTHKKDPNVFVLIRKNLDNYPKYLVFHAHPGPERTITQEPEGALTMASARKKAEMHMKHWNDPTKWKSDPDYGKVGQRGK